MGKHHPPRTAPVLNVSALGAGAATAGILFIAGILIWGGPPPVPDPVATQAIAPTTSAVPTYKGHYDSLTPSLVAPPAPPLPGPQKDAETPLPTTTVDPAPTTTVPPVPTTTVPPAVQPDPPDIKEEAVVVDVKTPPKTPLSRTNACHTIGVMPQVAESCDQIMNAVHGVKNLGGYSSRSGASCHPRRLAIDFMVGSDRELGDQLAEYVLENRVELGVTGVIWQQRSSYLGQPWKYMSDRGSATANHRDHVHVSFLPCKN
jgi:hypothetical protein